jgi:hypothetical protein
MTTIKIPADQVQVGDMLRFRMSKREPVRWVKVLGITPGKFTYGFSFSGGSTWHSVANKSDWATVKR